MKNILANLSALGAGASGSAAAGWLAKLPLLANIVLVLALANALASLTWSLIPQAVTPPAPAAGPDKSAAAVSGTRQASNFSSIANWHLFGEAGAEKPKPVVIEEPEELPDTTLRLTLRGVFASDDAGSAFAIIADQRGNEDTYGIDANVPGGALLKEIYADRVILLRNGRRETLRLPDDGLSSAQRTRVSSVRGRRTIRRGGLPRGRVSTVTHEASRILQQYRTKLLTDPQSVMNSVRAEPYRRGGRLAGYRVFPGRDKDLMNKVGLQPGDVVTSVNGIDLDSPLKGLEVMQSLRDGGQVTVNILRNGANQRFVIPLN